MQKKYLRSRETLEAVEEIRSEVARMRRGVERLQAKCTGATRSYGFRTGGGDGRGPEEMMSQLCDRRSELEQWERRLREREDEVTGWIDLLPRPRWRMVLRCRYLDGMELPEVAQELTRATGREFSVHQVYRLHREALQAAEKLWPLRCSTDQRCHCEAPAGPWQSPGTIGRDCIR